MPVVNALMVTWRSSLLTTGTPCVLCVYGKCAGVETLLLLFGRVVPEVIFQEIEASPSQVDSPPSPLTPSHPHTFTPSQLVRKDSRNHFHVMQKFIILGDMDGE